MVNVKNIADEADMIINERYEIDELADAAGGYFAMPSADELAYTELLFDVCDQFGIHYYSADKKARAFVAFLQSCVSGFISFTFTFAGIGFK